MMIKRDENMTISMKLLRVKIPDLNNAIGEFFDYYKLYQNKDFSLFFLF